jgi:hypothetical protein
METTRLFTIALAMAASVLQAQNSGPKPVSAGRLQTSLTTSAYQIATAAPNPTATVAHRGVANLIATA